LGLVTEVLSIQGRVVDAAGLDEVRRLLNEHPDWSRWRLSRQLAAQWEWRNGAGLLKDMAARSLLLKLEQRRLIELPARRRRCPNRMRLPPKAAEAITAQPITGKLSQLQPLQIQEVSQNAKLRQTLGQLLHQHHYLSYSSPVGENLQYLAWDKHGRLLAGCVFGAAAWKCAPRDEFIGWDPEARAAGLSWLCSQTRFLIPPWVEVKHLASHLLARWCRRLARDWQVKYGHRVCLVESFVDRERFSGACYRAANWHHVGATQGRSRQDRHHQLRVSRKEIFLCLLHPKYHQLLSNCLVRVRPPVACPKPSSGPNEWTGP
jgi:Domain of unknown function (DUF4338)